MLRVALLDVTQESWFGDERDLEVVVSSARCEEKSQPDIERKGGKRKTCLLGSLGSRLRSESLEQSLELPDDAFGDGHLRCGRKR